MMSAERPVTEADLHAYADGALGAVDRARVEDWLAGHEEDAARVRAWGADAALLRAAYRDVAVPPALDFSAVDPRARIGWAGAAAIALLAFGLGGGVGFLAAGGIASRPAAPLWADAGISAYEVFASEVRHPVEVRANEREHLVGWLSKRVGAPIDPPDLTGQGLTLLGGRLVPERGEPAAMLMYEDGEGRRFALLVARRAGAGPTSFRLLEEGDVSAVYWIDGALGYILAGAADRSRLIEIAHDVHEHLT